MDITFFKSVGPKTLEDLLLLGINTQDKLAKQDARELYERLCYLTGKRHDICVEDVFACAIAQAKDPHLDEEKKHWHYWSRLRKANKRRCFWAPKIASPYQRYHDEEWGVPVHDDKKLFEFLVLEGAQAGLSWETILKRRAGYATCFFDFDLERVSKLGEEEVASLLLDPRIIRNRAKIQATIRNAQAVLTIQKEYGSFSRYIWSFVQGTVIQPKRQTFHDIPTHCQEAMLLSKDLKKRGCGFVGPTIMYAFMQAVGLINDHTMDCFRYKDLKY